MAWFDRGAPPVLTSLIGRNGQNFSRISVRGKSGAEMKEGIEATLEQGTPLTAMQRCVRPCKPAWRTSDQARAEGCAAASKA